MEQSKQQMTIAELVSAIKQQMEDKSHAARYIKEIRRVYRHFSEYCEAKGHVHYNAMLG
jgi:hypothetical protein